MPTYLFKCKDHPSEQLEDFWPIEVGSFAYPLCPQCEEPMRRVFTAPAVHFKGGGWGGSSA